MELNPQFVANIIENSEEVKELKGIIKELLMYANHQSDCETLRYRRMSPIAAQTVEDILGPAHCDCNLGEIVAKAKEVT